jgi:hypothetical protein
MLRDTLKFITVVRPPWSYLSRTNDTIRKYTYNGAFLSPRRNSKTSGLLISPITEISRSHTIRHTHTHCRTPLISSSRRALHSAEQTQHVPLSGIRTHCLSHQEASAPLLILQGHENRDLYGSSHSGLRPTLSDTLVESSGWHLECIDTDMILLIPRV